MAARWLIVENEAEAKQALEDFRGARTNYLATSASAYRILTQETELPVADIHDYLSIDQRNSISQRNNSVVNNVLRHLDDRFHEQFADAPDGFEPFESIASEFAFRLDSLTFRFHELQNFFDAEHPGEVLFWDVPSVGGKFQPMSPPSSYLTRELLGTTTVRLLRQMETRLIHTELTELPAVEREAATEATTATLRQRSESVLKTVLKRTTNPNLLLGLKHLGFDNVGGDDGGNRLTIVKIDSAVFEFVNDIIDQRVSIDWWTKKNHPPACLRTGRSVELRSRSESQLTDGWDATDARKLIEAGWTDDIDCSVPTAAIMKTLLTNYFAENLPRLWTVYERSRDYFRRRKPTAVLVGSTTEPETAVLSQAANGTSTEITAFQHGGNFGYVLLDQLRHSDLKIPDVLCTFGDVISARLNEKAQEYGTDVDCVTVGCSPDVLGVDEPDTVDRTGTGSPSVAYVTALNRGDLNWGYNLWKNDTDYYRHQRELVRTLAEWEAELTIKLHPKDFAPSPLKEWAEDNGIRIFQSTSLTEIFPEVDVVVLDAPSTTLLQSLVARKPVVFLDLGWMEWYPEGKETVKNAVEWVDRTDENWQDDLVTALERAADKQRTRKRELENDYESFLERYCDMETDYTSLEERLFGTPLR